MSEWSTYSQKNRRAWNEIARARSSKYEESLHPAAFFRDGGSILDPRVTAAAGDVRGKSLLHLMCATGEETLSWAALGAHAVGVDISEEQIALARAKSQATNLDVRFEAADVGSLPAEFGEGFALVYTATGVLVWIPDIDHWADVIATALKPGGRFILWEEHPIAMCMWGIDGVPQVVDDYFQSGESEESIGWAHFEGGDTATELKVEFGWTLGEIVTALARHGLRIELLVEYPSEAKWRFGSALKEVRRLPGLFLLTAIKA
jgi:SAM-dependent methyltransferase